MVDKVAAGASFIYPLTGIPQVITVFNGNAQGVSTIS